MPSASNTRPLLYLDDVRTLGMDISDYIEEKYGEVLKASGINLDADEHYLPLIEFIEKSLEHFHDYEYSKYN